ncbi:hypothetical protein DXT99_18595 [Pontibacter diazotrophicus]|uniref:Uncharacterized protein n=2 Tax=Pontibacter diazotrophicus TaxID=1400979 RepID=A0A3D8L811_9BACT|nr:hypothetical protein DXT99_18595 [Pontibacter diazotrophicus]
MLIVKDLNRLHKGLMNSSTLLMKKVSGGLECSFLREGFTNNVVLIKDDVLAEALISSGVNGIIAGVDLLVFRSAFNTFSLRVKARKLYQELHASLPAANAAMLDAIAA